MCFTRTYTGRSRWGKVDFSPILNAVWQMASGRSGSQMPRLADWSPAHRVCRLASGRRGKTPSARQHLADAASGRRRLADVASGRRPSGRRHLAGGAVCRMPSSRRRLPDRVWQMASGCQTASRFTLQLV